MSLHSLPIFVRLRGRAVVLVGSGEAADAKRRLLERSGAMVVGEDGRRYAASTASPSEPTTPSPFAPSEVEGHAPNSGASTLLGTNGEGEADELRDSPRLAIVVDDEAAVTRLKARGLLVNAVDRPELCDFTLPAIVDRDPVLVAIGTGGASAGLAAALRQRFETLLPATLGGLADGLFAARAAWRARYPDSGERRRAIGAALAPGGPLDPLRANASGSPPEREHGATNAVTLVTMILTSPDPDDLTLRQARLLANADRVTHRADVPTAILDRARADADRIACDAPPANLSGLTIDVRMA